MHINYILYIPYIWCGWWTSYRNTKGSHLLRSNSILPDLSESPAISPIIFLSFGSVTTRVGNSLFGFSCKSLVFWQKRANRSFAHFKRANRSYLKEQWSRIAISALVKSKVSKIERKSDEHWAKERRAKEQQSERAKSKRAYSQRCAQLFHLPLSCWFSPALTPNPPPPPPAYFPISPRGQEKHWHLCPHHWWSSQSTQSLVTIVSWQYVPSKEKVF